MGKEPAFGNVSRLEKDKSEIINYNNSTKWMLGIVNSANFDIPMLYVGADRTKNNLLPYVKNIFTLRKLNIPHNTVVLKNI
jgi:hypothetical protein